MKTSLNLNWIEGMAFESEMNGHKITIDADETVGGKNKGPRPKPLNVIIISRLYRNGCCFNFKKNESRTG